MCCWAGRALRHSSEIDSARDAKTEHIILVHTEV